MKSLAIAMTVLGCLTACSGGSNSSPPGSMDEPPKGSGPVIENEDLTEGLMGVDADGNGVRDDIDRLIASRYSATPELKKAAEQKARALQQVLEATTPPQALAGSDQLGRSSRCIAKQFPNPTGEQMQLQLTMSKELEALTANTRERFVKYWDSNRLMAGGYFSQPQEPVCD